MGMFGFVLIPNRSVLVKSVELSNSLEGNLIPSDTTIRLPHLTVVQAPIRSSYDWKTGLEKFRNYAGFAYEPRTSIGKFYQQDKYIMLGVNNAKWLSTFNELIVNDVAPHVDVPEVGDKTFASAAEEESYLKTGYKRNLKAYEPHITIGVTEVPAVLPESTLERQHIRFHSLAFAEHGEYGTIKRILGEVPLPVAWD